MGAVHPVRLILISAIFGVVAGAATAGFTFLFSAVRFVLWDWMPAQLEAVAPAAVVTSACVLVVAVVIGRLLRSGRPTEPGMAEESYAATGRMPAHTPRVTAWAILSLGSGGAIGPEAPVADITGGIATYVADRLGLSPADGAVVVCASVAAGFSALFGSPAVGVIFALELLHTGRSTFDRLTIVASLAAGATGLATAAALLGRGFEPVYVFPQYALPRLIDLGFALPVGIAGALVGLVFTIVQRGVRSRTSGLRDMPMVSSIAAALSVIVALAISPTLLFSGQDLTEGLLRNSLGLGPALLIAMALGRLGLAIWQQSTGYYGGTIFPLITAGAALGLAMHVAVPFVPTGVAVIAVIAGLLASTNPIPLGVTVLLGAVSQPSLMPVAAVAAITGAVVRRAAEQHLSR